MLGCLLAQASIGDVLRDRDNGPLTGIFGIPDSTEGGNLLSSGKRAWDLSVTLASHSIDDVGSERLPADMHPMCIIYCFARIHR